MIKLTKYGKKECVLATIFCAVFLLICLALIILIDWKAGTSLAVLTILVWGCFAAFFRDPERSIGGADDELVSPADGIVRDCELIPGGQCESKELAALFEGKDMLRIGIFLSVLDVHVNRTPCDLKVSFTSYRKGSFHDARDPRAIRENESMILGGTGVIAGQKFPVAVKQISGAIARRIVCNVPDGTQFLKGERYGMIKFGSRTEIYLPAKSHFTPMVQVGDRVSGGVTVIAKFNGDSPEADGAQS